MVNQSFELDKEIPFLSEKECAERLSDRPSLAGPVLIYSSLLGGWTDSNLGLFVGLDDHGFHRGDGVFEAMKVVEKKPYLLPEHWQRLQKSMKRIEITSGIDFNGLSQILKKGLEHFKESEGLIRIYVTRGMGGFSTDPRECAQSEFFCVITPAKSYNEEKYKSGVKIGKSQIPAKRGWMATTKSLNYLPNVMMKKEAIKLDLDFMVSFDDDGFVCESSTENVIVLLESGELAYPSLDRVLSGCTMLRLFDLIEEKKLLPVQRQFPLREQDLLDAQALFVVGTTLDVLNVAQYEEKIFAKNEWAIRLRELIQQDQRKISF